MKRKIFYISLLFFITFPVFSQEGYLFNIFGSYSLGKISEIGGGIQIGGVINDMTSFLLDISLSDIEINKNHGFGYHLGGLFDIKILNMFLLGAGAGIGGFFDDDYIDTKLYPFIRGSFALRFAVFKLGINYDYCFDYGSRIGARIHLCFSER